MGLIASILVGMIAGVAASFIMKASTSVWIDIILGIIGGVVGGWITSLLLGVDLVTGFNLTSIIVSLIGAIVVIFIYRLIKKGK